MTSNPLWVIGVLCACVVVSELLVRRTPLRHLGTAMVVIIVTAVVANLGVIPTAAGEHPVYAVLFREAAFMAIFWLLLEVRFVEIAKAGPRLIALFLIGSLGTVIGAIAGMWAVGGPHRLPGVFHVVAGMYTGTYTGGSANLIAIASQYGLDNGALLASINAVDAAMTTVWMAINLVMPRLLPRPRGTGTAGTGTVDLGIDHDTQTAHPLDLALVIGAGSLAVFLSGRVAEWGEAVLGAPVPAVLVLCTLALIAAQVPAVSRLRGTRLLGMLGIYLFLAVIGALCDVRALRASGSTGLVLLGFVVVLLVVHGALVYGAAYLLRVDIEGASIVSQCNIGGGTSALALARSFGRSELVLPGILLGSLGTAIGTYAGIAVVLALKP